MNTNNNSLYASNGRYIHGGITEATSTNIEWWDRKVFRRDVSDQGYIIEKMYEGRPDNLAAVIYGDSKLWWLILQYNNILDIDTEFVAGTYLVIPTKERVFSEFLVGIPGGTPSTRTQKPNITPIISQ